MSETKKRPVRGRLAKIRKMALLQVLAMLIHTGIRRRGQHPKPHGCVRATFQVLDVIPTRYKVGLFAKPATYDALIRFSSGPQLKDTEPGAQGMSIKLVGVPGAKILEGEEDAGTHDFIMIDGPVFFVRDTQSYERLFDNLARLPQGAHPEKWIAALKRVHPQDVAVVENYLNRSAWPTARSPCASGARCRTPSEQARARSAATAPSPTPTT